VVVNVSFLLLLQVTPRLSNYDDTILAMIKPRKYQRSIVAVGIGKS